MRRKELEDMLGTRGLAAMEDLPEHMHGPLERYLLDGISPGSFLRAVLENDFLLAVLLADAANEQAMDQWARFMHGHMPRDAWGSPDKVSAWMDRRAEERSNA